MVDVRTIRDPELLRDMAVLLQNQNAYVTAINKKLSEEIARLRGENPSQDEFQSLKEQLEKQRQALFGRSSEKRSAPVQEETLPSETKQPQRGHGPTEQPNLPVEEVAHEMPPAQLVCPACGGEAGPMVEMQGQTEDSEEISVNVRSYVRVVHKRKKYRCPCNGAIVTAPGPPKLIEGGRYSLEFAVDVIVAKYLLHLPLSRQEVMRRAEGLQITRQTMWDLSDAAARLALPSYLACGALSVSESVVNADETRWPLLVKGESAWHAWSRCNGKAVFYQIKAGRGTREARDALGDYRGIVVADGYGVYGSLKAERGKQGRGFTLAHCWAHARRKFVEAEKFEPERCAVMLDLIGELYGVERQAPFPGPRVRAEEVEALLDLRKRLRQEQSRGIVKRIETTLLEWKPGLLPRSEFGKAVLYMMKLWTGLILFLSNPAIPLDNNAVERAQRGPVVGRKNHYGSKSRRGTEVAAIFYTLIETAKLWDVDPGRYLLAVLRNAVANPGAVTLPAGLLEE